MTVLNMRMEVEPCGLATWSQFFGGADLRMRGTESIAFEAKTSVQPLFTCGFESLTDSGERGVGLRHGLDHFGIGRAGGCVVTT